MSGFYLIADPATGLILRRSKSLPQVGEPGIVLPTTPRGYKKARAGKPPIEFLDHETAIHWIAARSKHLQRSKWFS